MVHHSLNIKQFTGTITKAKQEENQTEVMRRYK